MKLKFQEHNTKYVCEVFGMSEKTFDMFTKSMAKYFKKLREADNKNYDTKTIALAEYLESQDFKDVSIPLETANDFFMLGYIFCAMVQKMKGDGFAEFLAEMLDHKGHGHSHKSDDDDESELPN